MAVTKPCPSRARPGRGRSVPNHGIRARARRARSTRGGEVPEGERDERPAPPVASSASARVDTDADVIANHERILGTQDAPKDTVLMFSYGANINPYT